MRYLKIYILFIGCFFKARMEYQFSFWSGLFVQLVTYIGEVAGIWVLMNKFEVINGWSYHELILMFSFNLISFAVAGFFVRGPMMRLEGIVNKGEFDLYLSTPLHPLVHLGMKHFEYVYVMHIFFGLSVMLWSMSRLDMVFGLYEIFWVVVSIVIGVIIQISLMVITGSMCFCWGRSQILFNTTVYGIRGLISFPIDIYSFVTRMFLTFVIPYAFVSYYPSVVLFDKKNEVDVLFLGVIAVCVALLMMIIAKAVWSKGLYRYGGAGT